MRELKFRAWLNVENKMIQTKNFYGIDYYNGCIWYKKNDKSRGVNLDGVDIMQYTGLKDKNGVEIYEGDIVRWKDLESFDDFPIDEVFKVEYSDEFMKWIACYKNNLQYKSDLQDDLYDFTDNRDLEVVGNIFEDGDLIDS